jgi:two-component system chemotaxis sensor kinase CheA
MNTELIREFLLESFENLANISEELTTFEKNSEDLELVNSIFRKVHTLKGSAGFLGLKKLQEVTHAAESLLDLIRDRVIKITPQIVDCLLEIFDVSIEMLKFIEKNNKESTGNHDALIQKTLLFIKKPQSNSIPEEHSFLSGVKIPKSLFDEELDDRKKVTIKTQSKEVLEPVIEMKVEKIIEKKKEVEVLQTEKVVADNGDAGKNASVTDSVVRVNVQLLDKIMNVVGELVLNRNQILQYASIQDSAELNRLSQQLNTITSELQTDIMTTRMQPVGSVLSKFERIVRDLAKSQDKKIKLEIIGKETELDKTLLEAIRDPLTHLIRNSVDHGIEMPDIRKTKGKNEEGKITIRSFHESGQVSIEIKDDGNGIDPQRITAKAIEKGILTAEQVKSMSPKQILSIIFMPGFSTADQVTNISGRGVGMDVVKSNVEKIGGSVDIFSELGKGSTFKLKIPLTLAIVPALVVQDHGQTFAIPQISLLELVRFDKNNEDVKLEKLYGSEFFRLRGKLIPVFRLSNSLKLEGASSTSELTDYDFTNIVILDAEGRTYGLIVDIILDTEEIVVKPLSKELKNLTFYAGATIMGDGNVALILDSLGFYNFADKGVGLKIEKMNQQLDSAIEKEATESQELLICQLGDHRQYAIPLLLVNRLEEFDRKSIEWSGDQPLVKYGDFPMPLINLEKSLNLRGENILFSIDKNLPTEVPCVVINIRGHLYGLVVSEIIDIQQTESAIHSDSVDRKGLLGTVFLKDSTITILDVHTIIEDQNIGKMNHQHRVTRKLGKILIIEDSPLYIKIQKDFLEEEGYEVFTANNGQEAIDFLNGDIEVNLIVTDIEMPVMNGWDFTELIRKSNRKYSRVPVIAVSSKVSPLDREKGMKCGFNEHLEKLNKSDLHKAILEYI